MRVVAQLRRVPAAVWALTALFGLLLVGWTSLCPIGQAPDEPGQADLVFHLAEGGKYPDADSRFISVGVFGATLSHDPGVKVLGAAHWLTVDSAPSKQDRRSLADYGGNAEGTFFNQIPQHPPLYYHLFAAVLRAERALAPGEGAPIDREWHLLRIANALMMTPLPLLAWATARRMRASRYAAVAAAAFPLAVPQLVHLGASVNNDNLLILEASVMAVLLAGVVHGDRKTSTAVLLGGLAGLALMTKAFAIVLLVWIAVAYGYRAWRDRPGWWSAARPLLIVAAVATVVGGWWPIGHLLSDGHPYPSASEEYFDTARSGFDEPDVLWYLRHFVSSIVHRFWGNLGFFAAPLNPVIVVVATVACGVAVALALAPRRWSRGRSADRPSPARLLVLVSVLPLFVTLVFVVAYSLYHSSGRTPFIQGRYVLGAIVPLAVVVGIGLDRMIGRWAPLAVVISAGALQIEAVRVALRAWWAAPGSSYRYKASSALAWSPWPKAVLAALVLVTVGCAALTVWTLLRLAPGEATTQRDDGAPA